VRLSAKETTPAVGHDRLKKLKAKLLPPAAMAFDPTATGLRITLLQGGQQVFQRFIAGPRWTVVRPGKLFRFTDPAGTLVSGIVKAKVKRSPSGLMVQLSGIELDLSAIDGSALELRSDLGAATFASSLTCAASPSSGSPNVKCQEAP